MEQNENAEVSVDLAECSESQEGDYNYFSESEGEKYVQEEAKQDRRYPTRVRWPPDGYEANVARRRLNDDDSPTLRSEMNYAEAKHW